MDDSKRKDVYTVIERNGLSKPYWLKIGAGFVNRDGSLSVVLDAIPPNGRLQVRDHVEWSDDRGDGPLRERSNGTGNGNGAGRGPEIGVGARILPGGAG